MLAAAGPAGVLRDRILVCLWPDSDAARARSSLNQLLYALRRDLGVSDLVLGTTTLRLNDQLFSSDVADFQAAAAAGRHADAVSLYRGAFLGEFGIPDLPGFEQWAATERARLAALHAAASAALAAPDSPPHETPPAEPPPAAAAPAPPPVEPSRRVSPRARVGLVVLVAVGIAAVLLLVGQDRQATARPTPTVERTVAVLPFAPAGADPDQLAAAVQRLLAASLDGAGELRTIDPDVPDPVADLVVRGELARAGDRIRLMARLGPADSVRLLPSATVEGPADSLFQLVDRLAAELVAGRGTGARERLTRVAAATTGSLPAFKAYLEGEQSTAADRYADAVAAYQRAVALDSTFALAYYRLGRAAEWAGRDTLARAALRQAVRHSQRLGEHDRLLVEAAAAWRDGDIAGAETRLRAVVDERPEDLDAWFDLGEVLFHSNPLRGRSVVEAAEAFRRVLALDPQDAEALVHLARIEAVRERRAAADSLVRRAHTVAGSDALELRAFRAFALGDREGHKQATWALLAQPAILSAPRALDVAVYLDDLDGAERFGTALARSHAPELNGLGRRLLARTAMARGRPLDALRQLRFAERSEPISSLELRGLFAAVPNAGFPVDSLRRIARELEAWNGAERGSHSLAHLGRHRAIRLHLLGLVCAASGDAACARRAAAELEQAADTSDAARTFAASVRAHMAWRDGRFAEAARLLEAADWPAVAGAFEAEALDRYLLADALARSGRADEALGWFAALGERASYELVYLRPALEWRAKILEERGRTMEAAALRRRAASLRAGAPGPGR